MGHDSNTTVVFVGVARLPQPLVASAPSVAVELDVELCGRTVVAAETNLQLPRLKHLLDSVLVGRTLDGLAQEALLELEVRYSATFTAAVVAAVRAALRSAAAAADEEERPRIVPATPCLGTTSNRNEHNGVESVAGASPVVDAEPRRA